MRLLRVSLCVPAIVLGLASPSAAQLPAGATSQDEALSETARELFAKGVKASQQERWHQCRAAFLAALSVKPHPQVAGNLAGCELKLGMFRDAAEHITFFLHAQKSDAPAERRAAGEAVLKEASAKIATIQVRVNIEGADVLVDGRSAGTAPLTTPIFLDPGKHTIEARQDGYPTVRVSVDASAGLSKELALLLVHADNSVPVPGSRASWPIAVGAGTAALLLGGGIAFTVVSNGKASDADAKYTALLGKGGPNACAGKSDGDCGVLKGLNKSSDTFRGLAVGGYVTAGILGAAALTYALWPSAKPEAHVGLHAAPMLGAGTAGMVFGGEF
jgi:hypothetical protein